MARLSDAIFQLCNNYIQQNGTAKFEQQLSPKIQSAIKALEKLTNAEKDFQLLLESLSDHPNKTKMYDWLIGQSSKKTYTEYMEAMVHAADVLGEIGAILRKSKYVYNFGLTITGLGKEDEQINLKEIEIDMSKTSEIFSNPKYFMIAPYFNKNGQMTSAQLQMKPLNQKDFNDLVNELERKGHKLRSNQRVWKQTAEENSNEGRHYERYKNEKEGLESKGNDQISWQILGDSTVKKRTHVYDISQKFIAPQNFLNIYGSDSLKQGLQSYITGFNLLKIQNQQEIKAQIQQQGVKEQIGEIDSRIMHAVERWATDSLASNMPDGWLPSTL